MLKNTISTSLAAIILTLCVCGFAQSADKGDAVLNIVPADAILCARINNLNQATANIDQYIMGVSPMPVSTAGLLKGQLGMMFGNFDLKGFDVNGTFAAFAIAESSDTEPDLYILLPVTDYALLTDPNSRVSLPDSNGISAVGMGPSGKFFIKKAGSFALMTKDYRKLGSMVSAVAGDKFSSLASSIDAALAKQATTEPVWIYANMVKIDSVYKKEIADGIEEARSHLADPAASIQSNIDNIEKTKKQIAARDPNSSAIAQFDSQIDMMKKQKEQMQKSAPFMKGLAEAFACYSTGFMQQSKSITLSCNPKPTVLNFRLGINAVPGTEMAGMLVADGAAKSNQLAGYTEDGAAMNLLGRMNHPLAKKLNNMGVKLVAMMAGKDANDPNVVRVKKLADEYVDSLGNFAVCSFKINPNTKPMFDATYALEVKDANTFNKVTSEFAQMWASGPLGDFYKKLGMETGFTLKRGAESYKGVSIDQAKLTLKYTDINSPEAKMLDAMYGSGFEYRWAIVNGLWVCRISSDPNSIYKLIDQAKTGAAPQICSEMQKAIDFLPDAANEDAIFTYNYLRLMKMISAMGTLPFTLPDMPSKSNLVFGAKVGNGSMAIDFALPKEHLSEMMMAFQMVMQQQMQQQQMQRPPQNQGQPAPVSPSGK
jgi:hypothetical protein